MMGVMFNRYYYHAIIQTLIPQAGLGNGHGQHMSQRRGLHQEVAYTNQKKNMSTHATDYSRLHRHISKCPQQIAGVGLHNIGKINGTLSARAK